MNYESFEKNIKYIIKNKLQFSLINYDDAIKLLRKTIMFSCEELYGDPGDI